MTAHSAGVCVIGPRSIITMLKAVGAVLVPSKVSFTASPMAAAGGPPTTWDPCSLLVALLHYSSRVVQGSTWSGAYPKRAVLKSNSDELGLGMWNLTSCSQQVLDILSPSPFLLT